MSGRGRGDRGEPRRRSRMDLADHVVVITGWLIAAFCLKDFEYIESQRYLHGGRRKNM